MTDYRALCAELVEELESWIGYGDEADCADAHAVVDRARAKLAQPEPEGVSDEELYQFWESHPELGLTCDEPVKLLRAGLTRYARPAIEPVPVAERPWERDGWCDDKGECYAWDGNYWWMVGGRWWERQSDEPFTHSLPHYALPVPGAEVG